MINTDVELLITHEIDKEKNIKLNILAGEIEIVCKRYTYHTPVTIITTINPIMRYSLAEF